MQIMNQREKNILDAALQVFSRYGFKRTSMADIAAEAGISRQTLYKAFSSKEDVLRTHIRDYADNAVAEMNARLANIEGLGPQLDFIFDKITVQGFDMVRASPNARDIEEGVSETSKEELEHTAQRFQAIIAKVLSPYADQLELSGTTPKELAEFVQ
ncbi:MAG: helix-turn-helix domain-containing protein, partial [Pseudomonadota bacterium]|nr:helix-turn-helix domain-containing protein [Pseudomonadota bacterium]